MFIFLSSIHYFARNVTAIETSQLVTVTQVCKEKQEKKCGQLIACYWRLFLQYSREFSELKPTLLQEVFCQPTASQSICHSNGQPARFYFFLRYHVIQILPGAQNPSG